MMVIVEQSAEWELAGETEVVGENMRHCNFVHHTTWPGLETQAAAVGRQRLTAWAMALPYHSP
jgi:hypothetical protein